ncbi:DNA independent RNA polymerase I transcription factor [Candidozyma auris]|nr:hypothetical protein CAJCM15448_08850 [[Candida] auris]
MSVHEPLSRKRSIGSENVSNVKRHCQDMESESAVTDAVYAVLVKTALESLEKSDSIRTLTEKVNLPPTHAKAMSLSNLNIVLKKLIVNISKLETKAYEPLITALLRYPWMEIGVSDSSREKIAFHSFVDLYSQFLIVLTSSFPRYLPEAVKKIIGEFPDLDSDVYPHHKILQTFIRCSPTCINLIPRTLNGVSPHHVSSSTAEITNFVKNAIGVISYCSDLSYSIWQLVVELCIKLDVDLQNELDDLDDEAVEELINGEDDSDDVVEAEDEDNLEENGAEVYEIASTTNIKQMVSKLDKVMEFLLTITAPSFTVEEINNGNGVHLFNTLASLFKTHVLPTHFTKSIQFLMFHVSQYQPELADSFLVMLIDVAFNQKETAEKRLKALQYLSSYIARANNLTRHQVVFIVSYLIGWINKYISEREHEVFEFSDSSTGGMERFKLFYATFQTLLYIFCFRHKLLVKEDPDHVNGEWECEIDRFFQRVIIAKFNPLKYCDETVVSIFANLATKLNVCYCYSIIEHNKRERMIQGNSKMPSTVGNFRHKQEFLDLEAYFPFDPVVLPASKKIIEKNYVEWSQVNPVDEDDDEDDSGSHREEDDDEDDIDSEGESDVEEKDEEQDVESAEEDSDREA